MAQSGFRVVVRVLLVALIFARTICGVLVPLVMARFGRDSTDHYVAVGIRLANACESLGGAFLKLGQLLSARRDLLNEPVCRGLGRLQTQVRSVSLGQIRGSDSRGLSTRLACRVESMPVASGCIAQVHKAWLRDGGCVAVKLRRPEVEQTFQQDLALVGWLARLVSRLPMCADLPLSDLFDQLRGAILSQLDLSHEARLTARFASNCSANGAMHVPRVLDFSQDRDGLTTEYVPGLLRITDVPDPRIRRNAAIVALRALYKMIFADGLVHCDMHPGNVQCDERGRVVLLDCGLAVTLDDEVRFSFARFFFAFMCGDAQACANVVLDNASRIAPGLDCEAFVADVAAVLAARAPASVQRFHVALFAYDMFNVQRRHRVVSTPAFIWPILSLLNLEGTLKQCAPDLDFTSEARPYVFAALVEALRRTDGLVRLAAS